MRDAKDLLFCSLTSQGLVPGPWLFNSSDTYLPSDIAHVEFHNLGSLKEVSLAAFDNVLAFHGGNAT